MTIENCVYQDWGTSWEAFSVLAITLSIEDAVRLPTKKKAKMLIIMMAHEKTLNCRDVKFERTKF